MQEYKFNIGDKIVLKDNAINQFIIRLKLSFPFIDKLYYKFIAGMTFSIKERIEMKHPRSKKYVNMYKVSCCNMSKLIIDEDVFKWISETIPKCSFEESIIDKIKINYIPQWREYVSSK